VSPETHECLPHNRRPLPDGGVDVGGEKEEAPCHVPAAAPQPWLLNHGSGLGLVFLQVPPRVFADKDTPRANETQASLRLPALAKAYSYFFF